MTVLILFLDPALGAVCHGASLDALAAKLPDQELMWHQLCSQADVELWQMVLLFSLRTININCASTVALDGYVTRCLSL